MIFTDPTTPNITDFTAYVYSQGVPQADLPTTSEYLTQSLTYAQSVALIPPLDMPSFLYVLAVYNLGLHFLLKTAQDISPYTFFTTSRTQFNLLSFTAGVVIGSGDQGTSDTLLAPDWLKGMTLSTMDYLKTPWGRDYLAYAQQYGSNIVGVS